MSLVVVLEWQNGYFVLLRLVVCSAVVTVALRSHRLQRPGLVTACAVGLLLFHPNIKVQFGRAVWAAVDVLAGAMLIYGNLIVHTR